MTPLRICFVVPSALAVVALLHGNVAPARGAERTPAVNGTSTAALSKVSASPASLSRTVSAAPRKPGKSPADVGRAIDAKLAAELDLPSAAAGAIALTDDEAFLRRVSQDLIGELPTPEEITAFVLDPSAAKRAKAVDRLLADPRFGTNWARYFRDVILYRRTDDRAQIAAPSIVSYLTEKFNNGTGWDRIARDFITAQGDVRENGNTGLIMAQMGQAPEIAAEAARIFLGMQIQCAQCHDHPTDSWKRQQFHELAAFFPRIAVRPVKDGERRSFAVVSQEFKRSRPKQQPQQGVRRGGPEPAEYYMPDLNDPSAKGTLIQPVFFVSGQKLSPGSRDEERRTALADWITDAKNPWFARAFVNRVWAELVGGGFYEPVDDMGPERKAAAPETLELLCEQFVRNGYDLKWLARAIIASQTYQHESRSRPEEGERTFTANCPQPLRGDQIFDAITTALGIDESALGPPGAGKGGGAGRLQRGPRGEFDRTFGYDPSNPRDEVAASIPQALLLMNSSLVNRSISTSNASSVLSKLLADQADNESVVTELYLRCLAREPKPAEMTRCLSYVRENGRRSEAFEDLLWALVNSTEFTHRK